MRTGSAKASAATSAQLAWTRDEREQHDEYRRRGSVKPAEDEVVPIAERMRDLEEAFGHRLPHRAQHRPRRVQPLRNAAAIDGRLVDRLENLDAVGDLDGIR